MYACGIEAIQLDSSQEHFVLPETWPISQPLDEALMNELLAIQAAAAMDEASSARRT